MVRDKMPLKRPHILDSSPQGQNQYQHSGFSSERRQVKNNINSTYRIGLNQQNQNDSIKAYKKPLEVGVSTQITFRGFSMKNLYQTTPKRVNSNILEKSLTTIKNLSPSQYEDCVKYINNFTEKAKKDSKFRKKIGLSEVQAKSMNMKHLWEIPEESFIKRFAKAVISPFTSLAKSTVKLIFDNKFGEKNFKKIYKSLQETKEQDKIINEYKNATGLFNSVEKWENSYRKRFGFENIKSGENFIMSDADLEKSLQRRSFDSISIKKGKYSAKNLSTGNRIVSGVIGSVFYGLDAYNTTMKLSDDKETSMKEGKIKTAQQLIRITLASYFTATAFGVFQKQTNRSMTKALGVAGAMVVASEILGRLLVGNPILPTNKRKLEEINEKNKNSDNLVIKFGRILTGENKQSSSTPKTYDSTAQKITLPEKYIKNRYQTKFFGNEVQEPTNFKGTIPKKYKKDELSNLLNLIGEIDPKMKNYYEKNILKNLQRKGKIAKEAITQGFDAATKNMSEIEIGETMTRAEKIKKAVLSPFIWLKNIAVNSYKGIKKLFAKKDTSTKTQKTLQQIEAQGLNKDYQEALSEFKKTAAFQKKSKMSDDEKIASFADGFLILQGKGFKEEIQGIQNSLEWLKKTVGVKKVDTDNVNEVVTNILNKKQDPEIQKRIKDIGDNMNKMSFTAYAKDYADYDTSKYAVANNYTARLLSTTFLVFDAYNLTMLHSNDKKKAVDNGSQYATQELTRTAMSSYIISATNTVFQSLYNSSLAGALALTAASSATVAVLSRLAVGNSITPKSHKELLEQEERNKNNPMLKVTAAMVGKSMKKMDYGEKTKKDVK